MTYPAFKKIPRWNRDVTITEKIDGTNALVEVSEHIYDFTPGDLTADDRLAVADVNGDVRLIRAGSRTRWISPDSDNHGFAKWVHENADDLVKLGPGLHYGEWYGKGIQRGYGLDEKRFALFNSHRWSDPDVRPECCDVVPVLWQGNAIDLSLTIAQQLQALRLYGSVIAPGFFRPEGVVVYHHAAGQYFKILLEGDDAPKGIAA